jgi:hypothetical protein
MNLPIFGSFRRWRKMLTKPIVVETARPFESDRNSAK